MTGTAMQQEERGAHLQLAQRHHKIVAGSFKGRKTLEPEFATPGVVGKLALSFTTTGALAKHSRVTCQLPDHGWGFPNDVLNAVLQLPSPNEQATTSALPQVKVSWLSATRTLEFTLLHEAVIPGDTPLVLVVSGVNTPEKATPQAEAVVTTYEKLVVRATVPQSTRGGQVIDGPTAFTIPKIVPGPIAGAKRWSPFNNRPGAVSDVSLSFVVNGKVPAGGKLRVELPPDGWIMDEQPKVLLRTPVYHNKPVLASWNRDQHTLEVCLGNDGTFISMNTKVILTIAGVKNPDKETLLTAAALAGDSPVGARLTTLSANGGVVDGPSKLEVARISELRESDFEVLIKVLDDFAAETGGDVENIPLDKVAELLRLAGLTLSDELYQSLVVPCLPTRTNPLSDNGAADSGSETVPEAEHSSPRPETMSKNELLNVFAVVYAPAYKYGQELRLACGRGHLELVREWTSRGCNPNAADGSGWSALHYAADYGQLSVLNLLVEMTTPPSAEDSINSVPSRPPLEIDARDAHGWTPLMCAAANGHIDVLQRLLELGANVALTSTESRSALHWAATRGMSSVVPALLSAGADVNQLDSSHWTPLHCATLHGHHSCANLLITNGATATMDKLGYLPAHYGVPSQ